MAVAVASVSIAASPAGAQVVDDASKKEGDSRERPTLPPAEAAATPTPRVGERLSFSGGVDASSHFISFGADVWGGGNDSYPGDDESTVFAYGTLTAKFTDQFAGFVNIWSDLNNNAVSGIGGNVQEIDLNVGVTYTVDKLTFGLTHNTWVYASDEELAVEFSVAFNDADMITEGFVLNPSLLLHYRYDGIGAQEEALVAQLGIRPTFMFMKETQYPITLAVPAAVAFFSDDYQGGDGGGFGYANAGLSASVPLAFIPTEFGAWTAGVSAILWYTPEESIPGNPDETFVVTAVTVSVAF